MFTSSSSCCCQVKSQIRPPPGWARREKPHTLDARTPHKRETAVPSATAVSPVATRGAPVAAGPTVRVWLSVSGCPCPTPHAGVGGREHRGPARGGESGLSVSVTQHRPPLPPASFIKKPPRCGRRLPKRDTVSPAQPRWHGTGSVPPRRTGSLPWGPQNSPRCCDAGAGGPPPSLESRLVSVPRPLQRI